MVGLRDVRGAARNAVMIERGCGRGHEVLYLSRNGFDVTAVDFTSGAVTHLSKALAEAGLQGRVLIENFFNLDSNHDDGYDLMIEQTFFCAISPSDRDRYVQTAYRLLKKGALLAGLFYETGAEGGPPFNTSREDILDHFSRQFS